MRQGWETPSPYIYPDPISAFPSPTAPLSLSQEKPSLLTSRGSQGSLGSKKQKPGKGWERHLTGAGGVPLP